MKKETLAVLVPLGESLSIPLHERESNYSKARTAVWSYVAGVLQRKLGGQVHSFMPSFSFPVPLPYGVALGSVEPELLLHAYLSAAIRQSARMDRYSHRLHSLGKPVGEMEIAKGMKVEVREYFGDPEADSMIEWQKAVSRGTLCPDVCFYALGYESTHLSESQERGMFTSLADYALCTVDLEWNGRGGTV